MKKQGRRGDLVAGRVLNILLKTFLRSLLFTVALRAILVCSLPVEWQLALQNAEIHPTSLQPRNDHAQTSNHDSITIKNDISNQEIVSNVKNADVVQVIRSPVGQIAIGTTGDSNPIQTATDESQSSSGTINTVKNGQGSQVNIGAASHVTIGDRQDQITQAATDDGGQTATNQDSHENHTSDNTNEVVVTSGTFEQVTVKGSVNDAECPTTLNTSSQAELNQRSECPWKYEIDRNPFRTPQVILQAKPLCRRCIGKHSPDTRCETLKEWRTVHIQDGQGQMKTENVLVSVGSVCTAITLAPGQLRSHPM